MMDKLFILNELQKLKKFDTLQEFADFLGISLRRLYDWRSKNRFDLVILRRKFPEISAKWLTTGEGSMLASAADYATTVQRVSSGADELPTIDRAAQIAALVLHYGNGRTEILARLLHLQPQSVGSWKARNTLDIIRCYHYLPGISAEWLIAGTGPMLAEKSSPTSESSDTSAAIEAMSRTIREQAEEIARLKIQLEDSRTQIRLAAEGHKKFGK